MEIFPSYGGAPFKEKSKKVIRLLLKGCVNRPFFHISVQEKLKEPEDPVIEQIGTFDALPNKYNEKLVAINFQRLEYWLRNGAEPTKPVQKLLGLGGYFPVHPHTFRLAYLNRKRISDVLKDLKIKAAEICPDELAKFSESGEKLSKTTSQDEPQTSTEEQSIPSFEKPTPDESSDNKGDS